MNYKLYIGLDVQGGKPWNRQDAVNIIISVCRSRGITALSLSDMQGIYTYDNGKTVFENTLVLLLVDFKGDIEGLPFMTKRPEQLSIQDFIALTLRLQEEMPD